MVEPSASVPAKQIERAHGSALSGTSSSAPSSALSSTIAARKRIDPRWYSSSFLTLILVVGQWKFQILGDSYVPWFTALSVAVLTELVLFRLHTQAWPNLLSAYISGNSVAILVKPDGALLWPFVVGSMLAITSKYVLKYRNRHLWNPTNFCVCVLLLVASERVTMLSHQWGNDPAMVAIIWSAGLLTVIRAKVWNLTVAYLTSFALLAWVRTLFNHQPLLAELGPITGPMYQLFMFFMITDPRTIVKGRGKQVAVVIIIALVECAIRLLADFDLLSTGNPLRTAPPMFALFIVGPIAFWLELRRAPARARPLAQPAV